MSCWFLVQNEEEIKFRVAEKKKKLKSAATYEILKKKKINTGCPSYVKLIIICQKFYFSIKLESQKYYLST